MAGMKLESFSHLVQWTKFVKAIISASQAFN